MKRKLTCIFLCAALLLGLTGCAADAKSTGNDIYIFSNADGKVESILESDQPEKASSLSNEDIPVNMTVTYTLDGTVLTAEQAAGKTGHMTIDFAFATAKWEAVEDGRIQKHIPVPMAVLSGLVLENDVCSNISVTNGKLLDDGDRTVIIGFALPGVQNTLELDKDTLELPDGFTVSMDVKNFSMTNAYTFATTDIFQELDLDDIDSLDELNEAMDDIKDAMSQLISGSGTLYSGLKTLSEKSQELSQGVTKLAEGAAALDTGAASLKDGAAALNEGAAVLNTGLEALNGNSDTLNAGAKQVFESLLATTDNQLAAAGLSVPKLTIANYATVLDGVIAQIESMGNNAGSGTGNSDIPQQEPAQDSITDDTDSDDDIGSDDETGEGQDSQQEEAAQGAVTETEEDASTVTTQEDVLSSSEMSSATEDEESESAEAETYSQDEYLAAAASESESTADNDISNDSDAVSSLNDDDPGNAGDDESDVTISNDSGIDSADAVSAADDTRNDAEDSGNDDETENFIPDEERSVDENQNGSSPIQQPASVQIIYQTVNVPQVRAAAVSGANSVRALKAQLDAYYSFYAGLQTYTGGVGSAYTGSQQVAGGAKQLAQGAETLAAGASTLHGGITTLQDSLPALLSGIAELRDGAGELANGISRFNREAIGKIVDAVDGDLNGLVTRMRLVQSAAGRYSDDHPTKYIFRMETVGK